MSVEIVVHDPAPAAERWKATEATPEPEPSEPVPLSGAEPRRFAPGSVSVPLGLVLSTVTVRTALVKGLPATSVVTTRRS